MFTTAQAPMSSQNLRSSFSPSLRKLGQSSIQLRTLKLNTDTIRVWRCCSNRDTRTSKLRHSAWNLFRTERLVLTRIGFSNAGEAPIGPPPKSPVGRLIGAASVHLPRAGAVSFDERYYPVPNPRHLSRFSRRRTLSAVSRSVFATIREEFQNTKDKAVCSGFWTGRGPWFKSFRGRSWPADDISTG